MSSNSLHSSRPDIFSRGALELTFRLLRHNNVELALDIQNQLQGNKMPGLASRDPRAKLARDHFKITLNPQTIGRIVDALTQLGEKYLREQKKSEPGQLAVIRTLIVDWVALAEWHIAQVEPPSGTVH